MTDGAPPKRPSLPKALQLFGEYVVDSLIEEGPTWALYKAVHISNEGQRYRVRVLQGVDATRRQVIEAFARMAILLDSLKHEGIIPVANAGVDQGLVFIVNAEIPGITLRQRIETGLSPLDPGEIARIVRETASVLDYLHHHDPPIVHRTLDPSRILISQPNGAVKVLEVGYAHAIDEVARVEAVPHAPAAVEGYRAPEDVPGSPPDPRSDQYALARIARACLEARRTPILQNALRATEPVIARATETDPAARYASAGEFATAFAAALDQASSRATAPTEQHAAAPGPEKKISSAGIPRPNIPPPPTSPSAPETSVSKPAAPPTLRRATIIGTPGPAMPSAKVAPPSPPSSPSPPDANASGTAGPPKKISGSMTVPRPGGTSSSSLAAVKPPAPRESAPVARDTEPSGPPAMSGVPKAPAPAPTPTAAAPKPPTPPAFAKPTAPSVTNPHTSPTRESEIPLETISMVPEDEFDANPVTSVSPPDGTLLAQTHPSNPPDAPAAASPSPSALASAVSTAPLYGGPPAPSPPSNASPASTAGATPALPATFGLHDDTGDAGSYPPRVNPAPAAPMPAAVRTSIPPSARPTVPPSARTGSSGGARAAKFIVATALLGGLAYAVAFPLREPLLQLAGVHAPESASTPPVANHATNPVVTPPVADAGSTVAMHPVVPSADVRTVDAATTAIAPTAARTDAGSPTVVATADAGAPVNPHPSNNNVAVANNTAPNNAVPETPPTPVPPTPNAALPRRPSSHAQDQLADAIEQRIASCNVHLGHHAYIRVIYDGATGQAATVEFTGHTLDGNPGVPCLEAAVRAVPVAPFRDPHWEKHFTFMLR